MELMHADSDKIETRLVELVSDMATIGEALNRLDELPIEDDLRADLLRERCRLRNELRRLRRRKPRN